MVKRVGSRQGSKEFGHSAIDRRRGQSTRGVSCRGRREAPDGADVWGHGGGSRHIGNIQERLRNYYIVKPMSVPKMVYCDTF